MHLYQTHWWRCDGPCQKRRPHFGIVRRSKNKAPGPSDYWWCNHLRSCGGKFIKIKEPPQEKSTGKNAIKNATTTKPNADIKKYIVPTNGSAKPILKDSGNITANTKTKSNGAGGYIVGKKPVIIAPKPPPRPIFTGNGHTLKTESKHFTEDVTAQVRNIWANKQIPAINEPKKKVNPGPIKPKEVGSLANPVKGLGSSSPTKHKTKSPDLQSPPTKVRKIDDYFKSKSILKDLYGDDYKLEQSSSGKKLVAVKVEMVECPVCSAKYNNEEINSHLDECLNKDIIEKLSKDNLGNVQETQPSHKEIALNIGQLKEIVGEISPIPEFKPKPAKHTTTPKAAILESSNSQNKDGIHVTIGKSVSANVRKSLPPENIGFIDPVPAFKPMPSFPENTDYDIVDLTDLDFDADDIETVSTDKGRRKTESEVSLSSEGLFRTVVTPLDEDEVLVKAGSSKDEDVNRRCPICREIFDKTVEEHLDECRMFFTNSTGDQGASTSNTSIMIDDDEDDILDESQTLNATGTKTPCPSCMKMVEQDDMSDHLDACLDISLFFCD